MISYKNSHKVVKYFANQEEYVADLAKKNKHLEDPDLKIKDFKKANQILSRNYPQARVITNPDGTPIKSTEELI